jgi:hypothetical protein
VIARRVFEKVAAENLVPVFALAPVDVPSFDLILPGR